VLSGVGGDELLCGYPLFHQVPRDAMLGRAVAAVPGAERVLGWVGAWAAQCRSQPKLRAIGLQLRTFEGVYQLRRGVFMPSELPGLMGERASREGLSLLGEFAASAAARARDTCAAVGLLESTLYLRNQLLRDSDWASMAHSLELRTPLVDTQLLEALGPYVRAFTRGRGKAMLGRSPERPLTDAIIGRKKTGFSLPMSAWLAAAGLRSMAPAPELTDPRIPWTRRWASYLAARWLA
jgi:asparagine synthase (glutamine-hydrolysing)